MDIFLQMNGLALLAELFVKSSVLLGAALIVAYFLKARAPLLRHSILSIAIISLLILPILTVVVPGWQLNILPAPKEAEPRLGYVTEQVVTEEPLVWNATATVNLGEPPLPPTPTGKTKLTKLLLPVAWLLGLLFLSIRIIVGLLGVSRLTRFGISLSEKPWRQLYRLFMKKSPIKRNVKLVKNRRVPVPMTWGVLKPVVLMPQDSTSWSFHQCSSVLFHELAHVKRGDFLVRLLSRIACSIFWFNPLAWLAYRAMIREQEKACDQMVLQAGIKPSTYALSLLQVKLSSTGSQRLAAAAVGMAGDSALDERLTTILDKHITHREVTMRTKLILIVLFIFTITLVGTANPAQATTGQQEKKIEKKKEEKKKCDKDCDHGKKHIKIKKIKKGDGEHKVWVVTAPPAPPNLEKLEQQLKAMEKALASLEKDKVQGLEAIKKQRATLKKITDKKVKKEMEQMLQKLHVDLEAKMLAHEKSLEAMEAAMEKMELELQKKVEKMKKIEVHMAGKHGDFDIEDEHDILVDVHEEGDHEMIVIAEAPGKGHKLNIKIDMDQKLTKKQMAKLKKALKELEKDLPKNFDIDSKITKELQKINITATKAINEKVHEALEEAMEKFEHKMEKIIPEKEHKVEKRIKKKVIVKKKKSETK